MKNLLGFIAIFCLISTHAQTRTAAGGDLANSGETSQLLQAGKNGFSTTFINPKRPVDGTSYLFDDWKNRSVVVTNTGNSYIVKNINLNIKRNSFEAKIDDDSLFVFNFNNIKEFIVNGNVYKNYYWDDSNRIYEVIFEGEEFQILKGFKVEEVVGSANPMLNRSRDRLVRKEFIYLRNEDGIKPFRLSKGKIKNLIDDKDKIMELEAYVDKYELSYRNEDDVQKMLLHIGL